ncbi:hypothetical protein TNCV_4875401 [Trichonephila clavipes]|nr:hypothetical protein TNCV_4875401 [Trichonephila clavipes]
MWKFGERGVILITYPWIKITFVVKGPGVALMSDFAPCVPHCNFKCNDFTWYIPHPSIHAKFYGSEQETRGEPWIETGAEKERKDLESVKRPAEIGFGVPRRIFWTKEETMNADGVGERETTS